MDGIIDDNPAARSMGRKLGLVRSRRQRQEDKHPFSEEDRDRSHAAAATTDKRLADLFFTLERAGLRLGEGSRPPPRRCELETPGTSH
jgi:hypothetical protein